MSNALLPQNPQLISRVPVWPQPGTVVNSPLHRGRKYVFGQVLSTQGFFSVVYRGHDNWGDEVAIKAFLQRGDTFENVGRMALAEAVKHGVLRHPQIVHAHDAFQFDNINYVVSEMCGLPISSLVGCNYTGRLWVKPIAKCLLKALGFMHDAGYVHQDVHLNNVLTSWSRCEVVPSAPSATSFKLGDLGLAKLIGEINRANTMLAEWMYAPEYLDASFGPMDHRMDLYHAALTLLQVLYGQRLVLTREDTLNAVPRRLAETLGPFGKGLSLALRRHVEVRPQTALAFWEHLKDLEP